MSVATAPFRLPPDLSPEQVLDAVDVIARAYVATSQGDGGALLECDEPTVAAITLAAQLVRVGEIDRVVVIAEKEHVGWWPDEFTRYTALDAMDYYGAHRARRRLMLNPLVLASTPDTLRTELATRVATGTRSHGSWTLGPLGVELAAERVLWIFDGLNRVDSRASETYKGFEYFFAKARAQNRQRLIGLRFPGLSDPGTAFDLGRLFCPSRMPSVSEFATQYCFPVLTEQPVLRPDRRDDFAGLFSGVILP